MRTLLMGCALAMVVAVLAGCGGSSTASASDQTMQKDAALYQIDQIEQTWHKAASTHNVNLMMTLWAPDAVFNIGTETLTGKAQIRHFFATENKAFMPQNHWESDTPSYKIRDDGQRRQGDPLLRVPLHRHQDGEGGECRRRRPQRAEDQREVADRVVGRRDSFARCVTA